MAQQLYYPNTPAQGQSSKEPPLFEVSNYNGVRTSPAESTLTPAMTTTNPTAVGTICNTDADFMNAYFENEDYDNALANEVIDDIIFDENHGEKLDGNDVVSAEDNVDVFDDDDNELEEFCGDSDGEGEEADIHNIALAGRLINDDDGVECFARSTAKQNVIKHVGNLGGNMHEDLIDDDVGEPTSGVDECWAE
jgi:hypothetical protein